MTDELSQRALNRATLARHYLLERTSLPAVDAIEQLAGMQSQAPLAPYMGLWTRLRDFAPGELATLTEERQLVRLHLMRHTVHLASARDALSWRALFAPQHAAQFSANFRGGIEGVDLEELLGRATSALPGAAPGRLGQGRPRDLGAAGGVAGRAAWLRAVDELVLRYLGAFGSATIADVQAWSGLTRLRGVVERLALRTFRGQAGQLLHDLPDAPRPAEDAPAPRRFLPEYDNLLLSHKDRTRVIPHDRPVRSTGKKQPSR